MGGESKEQHMIGKAWGYKIKCDMRSVAMEYEKPRMITTSLLGFWKENLLQPLKGKLIIRPALWGIGKLISLFFLHQILIPPYIMSSPFIDNKCFHHSAFSPNTLNYCDQFPFPLMRNTGITSSPPAYHLGSRCQPHKKPLFIHIEYL